jgi:hypothetical protein
LSGAKVGGISEQKKVYIAEELFSFDI